VQLSHPRQLSTYAEIGYVVSPRAPEEQAVSDEVRKEHVDVEGDVDRR